MASKARAIPLPDLGCMGLAAIDPGKRECAVALAGAMSRKLLWVGPADFVPFDRGRNLAGSAIVELPSGNGRDAPPDDLIAIAAHGCLLAGRICSGPVRMVSPTEWKGSCKKPIHHGRMWDALTAPERALLGGRTTVEGIRAAAKRGAAERWRRSGAAYYRAGDLPEVQMSTGSYQLTHNELDAVALLLFGLGRIDSNGLPTKPKGRK